MSKNTTNPIPFDLDNLFFELDFEGETCCLNIFALPGCPAIQPRNSNDYDYDHFRRWADSIMDLHLHEPLFARIENGKDCVTHMIDGRYSFATLLQSVRAGIYVVPWVAGRGWVVSIELYDSPFYPLY